MRKKMALALAGLAALAIGASSLTFASAASPKAAPVGVWGRPAGWSVPAGQPESLESHAGGQTLVVNARATNFQFINVDGRGFNAGDYFVLKERVFNRQQTRRVGRNNIQCTANFPARFSRVAYICEVVMTLSNSAGGSGQITMEGAPVFRQNTSGFTLAITGGTGHFQNVRGEVHLRFTGQNTERWTLHLLP